MDSAVESALSEPITSHVAPGFIETFGQALERLREVFQLHDGQTFILAGSGTLAMDSAAANLIEPGDAVLVLISGYFGGRFADIFTRYGAQVEMLSVAPGDTPSTQDVETLLARRQTKLVAVTHVDTSTGVLADVRTIAGLARAYGALTVVDGVCSIAGEELRMSDWGVDLAFTASQKAIGAPPGLALLAAGPRALQVFNERKTPPGSYYAGWDNWLPVMQAYEARKLAYFGTPAVNLVAALNAALGVILNEGIYERTARHVRLAEAFRSGIEALGMSQIPTRKELAAHTMTAPRFPDGVNGPEFLRSVSQAGVTVAGGLHPAIRSEYFRVGHMGAVGISEILTTLSAIEQALANCLPAFLPGAGVTAALQAWTR